MYADLTHPAEVRRPTAGSSCAPWVSRDRVRARRSGPPCGGTISASDTWPYCSKPGLQQSPAPAAVLPHSLAVITSSAVAWLVQRARPDRGRTPTPADRWNSAMHLRDDRSPGTRPRLRMTRLCAAAAGMTVARRADGGPPSPCPSHTSCRLPACAHRLELLSCTTSPQASLDAATAISTSPPPEV